MTAHAANTLPGEATGWDTGMDLATILAGVIGDTEDIFAPMGWADDEIYRAIGRHRTHADLIFHAFGLLKARDLGKGIGTEFVYRGHAREILDRLAAGADTRPATAAEICLATTEVSKVTPVNGPAFGLYLRMWLQAFPDNLIFDDQAEQLIHYEKLHGSRIDDLEQDCRHRLGDNTRMLGTVSCHGRHHTVAVRCRFAT